MSTFKSRAMAKEKVQKDKQRSTKHTHKAKDRVTRTPQKPGQNMSMIHGWLHVCMQDCGVYKH